MNLKKLLIIAYRHRRMCARVRWIEFREMKMKSPLPVAGRRWRKYFRKKNWFYFRWIEMIQNVYCLYWLVAVALVCVPVSVLLFITYRMDYVVDVLALRAFERIHRMNEWGAEENTAEIIYNNTALATATTLAAMMTTAATAIAQWQQ